MDGTAAERIERFLEDHPGVPLTVAVGFSSPRGIAWLARRTRDRTVRLLIGDCRPRYFRNATREDRDEALAFLDRPDVTVWNWYRRHGETSDAHLKVWIVHDAPRPAALNGSANLSHKGLYLNEELVTGIPDAEVDQAIRRVEAIFDKAWDAKVRLRKYIASPSPARVSSSASKEAASSRPPSLRVGPSQPPASGRGNRGGGCFRIAKGCVSFVVVLLLLAALVGMLGRGCTDGSEPAAPVASTSAASPTTALFTTTTVATVSATAGNVTKTVPRPASSVVPEESPVVLIPLVAAYVEALGTFVVKANDLVQEINFVNETWDNRGEDNDRYSETEASLLGIAEQARDLASRVRYQRVPPVLRGMHGEPGGPLRLANELADLADRVIAGLQIPVPNDGSERRAALRSFNETADSFMNSANRILRYIDESSRTEGQLTVGGQTTTTRALAAVELVDEAVVYVEGLTRFSEVLDDIVLAMNVVNEAWDNKAVTGVSYSTTEEVLVQLSARATAFYEQVRDHPIPKPIRVLGEGPIRAAAPIAEKANEVLAGLRLPAPEPGFVRLAALDDLNAIAEDFKASVGHVVYEVYENARTSGLAEQD